MITTHVLELLRRADLVIADLSEHNPNVFYELALRHGVNRPCVHLIQKEQRIPFDISLMRTIPYNLRDPDELENARHQLEKQVATVLSRNDNSPNPIRGMFEMQQLIGSKEPVDYTLHQILESVEELGRRFRTEQITSADGLSKKMLEDIWNYFSARVRDGMPTQTREEYLRMLQLDTDVRVGDAALSDGNRGLALALYERVLKEAPDHKLAMIGKAKVLRRCWIEEHNEAMLMDAMNLLKLCIEYHPGYERAYYNIACYKTLWNLSRGAQIEDANGKFTIEEIVGDIRKAIQLFGHYRALAQADPDFDSLREYAEFQKVLQDGAESLTAGKGVV